jgi:hypothetical protein
MVFAVRHVLHEGLLRSSMPWRRPSYERVGSTLAWWPVSVVVEAAVASINSRYQNVGGRVTCKSAPMLDGAGLLLLKMLN